MICMHLHATWGKCVVSISIFIGQAPLTVLALDLPFFLLQTLVPRISDPQRPALCSSLLGIPSEGKEKVQI